jgi:hypothetical protein
MAEQRVSTARALNWLDFDRLLRIVTRFTLSLPPEGSILAL